MDDWLYAPFSVAEPFVPSHGKSENLRRKIVESELKITYVRKLMKKTTLAWNPRDININLYFF